MQGYLFWQFVGHPEPSSLPLPAIETWMRHPWQASVELDMRQHLQSQPSRRPGQDSNVKHRHIATLDWKLWSHLTLLAVA